MAENISNNASTTLASNCGLTDGTITVTSSTGFPAPNYRLVIDSEIMLVTAVDGNTWTVTRAQENTALAGHTAGASAMNVLTAQGLQNYIQTIMAPIYCGPQRNRG
jgi:hypothetical protein